MFVVFLLFSHGLEMIYDIDILVVERTLYLREFLQKSYL